LVLGFGSETHHFRQTPSRDNVARVYQAVQVARALFDLLAHVIVDFHVEDVGDKVEGVLVVLHFCVEAGQVEAVGEVVLVDLAEVFIAACCYELGNENVSRKFLVFSHISDI
jgi:hypothetical protein